MARPAGGFSQPAGGPARKAKMGRFHNPRNPPQGGGGLACGFRVAVLDGGAGVWVYLRLGGDQRYLVECRRNGHSGASPLSFLRGLGELGPLTPLSRHFRPDKSCGDGEEWLWVLGILRGLVLRRGGSWILWRQDAGNQSPEAGFSFSARVVPRAGDDPPPIHLRGELTNPPALVLGLGRQELFAMAARPQAMVANSSPALKLPWPGAAGGYLLLGGDLRPMAWQSLLGDLGLCRLLGGVSRFADGAPSEGFNLARGLKMAALPWLALGALLHTSGQTEAVEPGLRRPLATPEVGALLIDVDHTGGMKISGLPWEENRLVWKGLSRPISDCLAPAPWPLRRALTQYAGDQAA